MAIQKNVTINRKEYERIKKYDRTQMDTFIQSVYKNGYTDGVRSVPGIDIAEVRKTLLSVKGLGEKRVEAVLAALEKEMKSEKN